MTLEELRAELAQGQLRAGYLLAGQEPLLRDDALSAIREAVLEGSPEDFNLDRLQGGATSPAALLDAVRTLPVMAMRRLVVLREPEAGRGGGELSEALVAALGECESGGGTVLVVLAARVDARHRWVKAFGSARVQCDAPRRAREIAAFVRAEAKRQGIELERGAAELLAERVGPQLLILRQEIVKAGLLAGAGAPVSRAHVGAGTLDVAEEPIWDLTDAIGEGRGADALAVLGKLLAAGAPAPVLLGALVSHFRRLLRLRSGGSLSAPPFVQRKLEAQCRRYTPRRLVACLRAIHQTDLALKGEGGLAPELVLERLVLGLVG
jgi:DNA polymerase-3 subunit delta